MSADAGGVRLHRSTALDQVAHFDPGTGLWHSDELVEVVRYDEVLSTDGAENVTHIAYPAAQAKAMEAVVRDAVAWHVARNSCGAYWNESDALEAAVRAYLSTLPRAHGGEGGGA